MLYNRWISLIVLITALGTCAARNLPAQENTKVQYEIANTRVQLYFFKLFNSFFNGTNEVTSIEETKTAEKDVDVLASSYSNGGSMTKEIKMHYKFFQTIAVHSQRMEEIFPVLYMKHLVLTYAENFATGALFYKYADKNEEAVACKQVSDYFYLFSAIETEEIVARMRTLIVTKWQTIEVKFEEAVTAQQNYQNFVYNRRILSYEKEEFLEKKTITTLRETKLTQQETYQALVESAKQETSQHVDVLNSFMNAVKFSPGNDFRTWKSTHWESYDVSIKMWSRASEIVKMLGASGAPSEANSYETTTDMNHSTIVETIRSFEMNKLVWKQYSTQEEVLGMAESIKDKSLIWDSQSASINAAPEQENNRDNQATTEETTYYFREIALSELISLYGADRSKDVSSSPKVKPDINGKNDAVFQSHPNDQGKEENKVQPKFTSDDDNEIKSVDFPLFNNNNNNSSSSSNNNQTGGSSQQLLLKIMNALNQSQPASSNPPPRPQFSIMDAPNQSQPVSSDPNPPPKPQLSMPLNLGQIGAVIKPYPSQNKTAFNYTEPQQSTSIANLGKMQPSDMAQAGNQYHLDPQSTTAPLELNPSDDNMMMNGGGDFGSMMDMTAPDTNTTSTRTPHTETTYMSAPNSGTTNMGAPNKGMGAVEMMNPNFTIQFM